MRGKLILSKSTVEIDCILNKDKVPEARDAFDKRVIISGIVHYDGTIELPSRVDVVTIRIVKSNPDLLRWRGSLNTLPDENESVEGDEWC